MKYIKFLVPVLVILLIYSMYKNIAFSGPTYRLKTTVLLDHSISKWNFGDNGIFARMNNRIIKFEGEDRAEIETDQLLKIHFSKTNRFYATVSFADERVTEKERTILINSYNGLNEKLYTLSFDGYYDQPYPVLSLSDFNGALAIGHIAEGVIEFYSETGDLVQKHVLFPESEFNFEKNMAMDRSIQPENIAVAAQERSAAPAGSSAPNPDGNPHVFVFSQDGILLWEKTLSEFSITSVSISPAGNYLITNNFTIDKNGQLTKNALLLDQSGNELKSFNILYKNAVFSDDSNRLLMTNNKAARTYDVSGQKYVWDYVIQDNEMMISAARISHDGNLSALLLGKNEFTKEGFIFTQPKLLISKHSDNTIREIPLQDQVLLQPELWISPKNNDIYVGTKNSLQIYQEK